MRRLAVTATLAALVAATATASPAWAEVTALSVQVQPVSSSGHSDVPIVWEVGVNNNLDAVTDVVVDLELPGPVTFATDPVAPAQLTCTGTRCVIASIPAGGFAGVRVSFQPGAAGSYALTARLSPRPEDDPTDDVATDTVDVAAPLPPGTLTPRAQPGQIVYGGDLILGVTFRLPDGTPAVGVQVGLYKKDATDPVGYPRRTDGTGTLEQPVDTSAPGDYQWRSDGYLDVVGATASPVVEVRPVVLPTVSTDPVRLPPGGSGTVSARVTGPVAGRTLTFQHWTGTSWVDYAQRLIPGPGLVSAPLTRLTTGTHRYRAVVTGTDTVPSTDRALPVSMTGRGNPRDFVFEGRYGGQPVRWNPCVSIPFAVNARLAPAGGVADLTEALRRISLATGLVFRSVGRTTYIPHNGGHPPTQFVIAWARPNQTNLLPSFVLGVGGISWLGKRVLTGDVVINAALNAQVQPGFGAGGTEGSLLMHELAHAMGLDHAATPLQIMVPVQDNSLDAAMWGAGDLSGLKRLGRTAGCLA